MAQTNFTPILIYGSSTPTNVPLAANLTNSATGSEIAINVADKNLFFKDSTNAVNTVPIRQSSTSSNGWLSSTDWNTFNGKQAALVSGTNIKTINGTSLLGSGDVGTIDVAHGGTGLTTLAIGYIPYGNGTSALSTSANLNYNGTSLSSPNFIPSVAPTTAWGIDFAPSTSNGTYVSIANNGVYALGGGSGIVYVWDNGGNGVSATNCYYGTTSTFFNPQALYSNTAGLATKVNIYYNGAGAYVIQNLTGGTLNFFISTIRLRTSV